jgi:hypothetical protein
VLSPALVIVLFALLGGQAAIVTGWEGQEHVTALFAFRQLVLKAVRECIESKDVRTFEQTLSELQIVKTARVPQPQSTKNFDIPLLSRNTVWINGPAAPYADVATHGLLFQTKSDMIVVFLMEETQSVVY